jgi:hypothetical protein
MATPGEAAIDGSGVRAGRSVDAGRRRSPALRRAGSLMVVVLLSLGLSSCKEADVTPFRGYGAWVDVFDWSPTGSGLQTPPFGLRSVDALAANGVQTLFIQTSRATLGADVVDRTLLTQLISRARSRGLTVVGWYLPEHVDQEKDVRRLKAIAGLAVDGIGVDIESHKLVDVSLRNRRLVDLMRRLDEAVALPVTAIINPPYIYEVLSPTQWPNFPYRQVHQYVESWTLMAYWTNRAAGTAARDPYFYLTDNVRRLRANLGQPRYDRIHLIGGLAARTTLSDIRAMRRAAVDTRAMGGSLYDWNTTPAGLMDSMRGFRDFRTGQPTK